jgi:hypothetical protein
MLRGVAHVSGRRNRRPLITEEAVVPLLDLFWTMTVFFLWVAWFWLLIAVFADIFRSEDLSGWSKAAWVLLAVFLPYLGVFAYLIARGSSMGERQLERHQAAEAAVASYIRGVASTPSPTEELARLAELRDTGALTDAEFSQQKARILVS